MACRYYDDLVAAKIKNWLPSDISLRVLKPDESKKFFELTADDTNDKPFKLPLIALSRNTDIELLSNVKSPKSYDGLRIFKLDPKVAIDEKSIPSVNSAILGAYKINVLPIRLLYNLDIITKTVEESDEYLRTFLFKLINNPTMKITIPYQDLEIEHTVNIRVLDRVSDTSSIAERLFSGQFQKWTIQFELQDAFLFSIPYKKVWKFVTIEDGEQVELPNELSINLEVSKDIHSEGEIEYITSVKK